MVHIVNNYELKVKKVRTEEAGAVKNYGKRVAHSGDVVDIANSLIGDSAQEQFLAFYLDVQNRLLGYYVVGVGSLASCPVDVSVLFRAALAVGTSNIILAHCHPSDNAQPSSEDINITKKIKSAASLLDICLLDHVIVTPSSNSFSFAEREML